MVDDHGVAVNRERLGEDDHALVGGGHRRLTRRREVVSEVDLAVDLAAAVHVGARLGEVGEHLRVARLRERPVPERLVGGGGADLPLGLLGLLAQIAVDHEESVDQRLGGGPLRQELGHLGLEERVLDVDRVLRELARANLGRDPARGGVARLVAGADLDRRGRVVVPRQRDQRDAGAFVGRAEGERRERRRAGQDVGPRRAGDPEHDEPAPARREVARGSEQLDLRRREVDGDGIAGDRAVVAPDRTPEGVARPHLDGRAALAEPERRAVHHDGNLHPAAEAAVFRGHRCRLAGLLDADLDPRHVAASRLDDHGERRLLPDEARWSRQGLHTGDRLPPYQICHGADDGHEQDQDEEHPGLRTRPLGHNG